jgi:hypothetical protein
VEGHGHKQCSGFLWKVMVIKSVQGFQLSSSISLLSLALSQSHCFFSAVRLGKTFPSKVIFSVGQEPLFRTGPRRDQDNPGPEERADQPAGETVPTAENHLAEDGPLHD